MTIQHYHLFFYGSWGRGGGTGSIEYFLLYKTANGLVPFDEFVKYNTGQPNILERL
jgi:hypothetical protein